eukprot:m.62597 g.62597  ORF g.62597 m.62597 type:complete len:80 (+) comp35086_c0_seq1:115-354(+)
MSVSPLIKASRYGLLSAGVLYGITRNGKLKKDAEDRRVRELLKKDKAGESTSEVQPANKGEPAKEVAKAGEEASPSKKT